MKKIIVILILIILNSCDLSQHKKEVIQDQIQKEQLTKTINLLVNVKLIQHEIVTLLKYKIAIKTYCILHETKEKKGIK